jgi:hypothetical protein
MFLKYNSVLLFVKSLYRKIVHKKVRFQMNIRIEESEEENEAAEK